MISNFKNTSGVGFEGRVCVYKPGEKPIYQYETNPIDDGKLLSEIEQAAKDFKLKPAPNTTDSVIYQDQFIVKANKEGRSLSISTRPIFGIILKNEIQSDHLSAYKKAQSAISNIISAVLTLAAPKGK